MILVSKHTFIFLFTLLVIVSAAAAQPRPTHDFYVNDFANVLSAQDRSYILERANAFYHEQGSQVVVVTVENMGGYGIEEYANTLFNSWGIGSSANNSGVLLIYAHEEGRLRIEVGYGLEGALTDGTAGYILDTFVLPHFKEDHYSQGMVEGFDKILETITGEFAPPQTQDRMWVSLVVISLWGFMMFLFQRFNAKRFPNDGGIGGRSLGGGMGGRSLGGGGSRGGGGRSGGGGSSRSSR